jgi:hypothetical protein
LKFNDGPTTVILDQSLLTFTGERDGGHNLLRWEVSASAHLQSFSVEREMDGDFKWMGEVTADGGNAYSFLDSQPLTGTNRYRLKIHDQNGHFTYSNVVEIRDAAAGVTVEVWPNPASSEVNVQLLSDGQRNLAVNVTDLAGRSMLQKTYHQSGIWEHDFSAWARGSYILTVVDVATGEKVYARQLVLR